MMIDHTRHANGYGPTTDFERTATDAAPGHDRRPHAILQFTCFGACSQQSVTE